MKNNIKKFAVEAALKAAIEIAKSGLPTPCDHVYDYSGASHSNCVKCNAPHPLRNSTVRNK